MNDPQFQTGASPEFAVELRGGDHELSVQLAAAMQVTWLICCAFPTRVAFERFQLTGAHRIATPFNFSMNKQLFTSA